MVDDCSQKQLQKVWGVFSGFEPSPKLLILWARKQRLTDKLPSYGAVKKEILPGVEHRQHKGLNNRAENSHQPTRQKEKQMRKFKSPKQAQRFLPVHGQIRNLFGAHRYKMVASDQRKHLIFAWDQWQKIVIQAKCA